MGSTATDGGKGVGRFFLQEEYVDVGLIIFKNHNISGLEERALHAALIVEGMSLCDFFMGEIHPLKL